jgi:hypothetical protein
MIFNVSTTIRHAIIPKAGMPNQWALNERLTSPSNKKAIAWPIPQPGHQVMPISLNGHRVKGAGWAGSQIANAINAAIQNISSKYLKNNFLIKFV